MSHNVQWTHSACQAHCAPESLDPNPLNLHICWMETGPFHRYLKAWRRRSGMTLEKVGAALSCRHTTVSRWESGTIPIKTSDLERLARLYHIAPERIVTNPNEEPPDPNLTKAGEILRQLDPQDIADWLRNGERLTRR